jgi:hypothetical protein
VEVEYATSHNFRQQILLYNRPIEAIVNRLAPERAKKRERKRWQRSKHRNRLKHIRWKVEIASIATPTTPPTRYSPLLLSFDRSIWFIAIHICFVDFSTQISISVLETMRLYIYIDRAYSFERRCRQVLIYRERERESERGGEDGWWNLKNLTSFFFFLRYSCSRLLY